MKPGPRRGRSVARDGSESGPPGSIRVGLASVVPSPGSRAHKPGLSRPSQTAPCSAESLSDRQPRRPPAAAQFASSAVYPGQERRLRHHTRIGLRAAAHFAAGVLDLNGCRPGKARDRALRRADARGDGSPFRTALRPCRASATCSCGLFSRLQIEIGVYVCAGSKARRDLRRRGTAHVKQCDTGAVANRRNQSLTTVVEVAITPAAARREARDTEGCSAATSVCVRTDPQATG